MIRGGSKSNKGRPRDQADPNSYWSRAERAVIAMADAMREDGNEDLIRTALGQIGGVAKKLAELDANWKPKYDDLKRLNPR